PAVLANTSGFFYYVSITGITGTAVPDASKGMGAVTRIKRHTKLPVAVGFCVPTAAHARPIAKGAAGGGGGPGASADLKAHLNRNGKAGRKSVKAVTDLVTALADGVRSANRAD